MHRAVPRSLGLLLVLTLVGCGTSGGTLPPGDGPGVPPTPPPPSTPPTFQDGFETGLGLWTKDADVPPSPEDPTVPVTWSIDGVDQPVQTGSASARFVLDGRQDDGTIWLERAFDVGPQTDWTVHIAAAYWSEHESFNSTAYVALYAGPTSPEVELDFEVSGYLNEVAGWKTYVDAFNVTSGPDGLVHVGVGLSVIWETWITYYLDDVQIWIEPR